jgi:hypothetical protein
MESHVLRNMAVYVLSADPDSNLLKIVQLRTQYNLVTTLRGLSGIGCRYTTELGMNIGVAEQSVWTEYTAVCLILQVNQSIIIENLMNFNRNIPQVLHIHTRASYSTIS